MFERDRPIQQQHCYGRVLEMARIHERFVHRGKIVSIRIETCANAIDIDSVLGGLESPPAKPAPKPTAHATQESVEVDLSIVLEDIKPHSAGAPTPARGGTEPLPPLQGSDHKEEARTTGEADPFSPAEL